MNREIRDEETVEKEDVEKAAPEPPEGGGSGAGEDAAAAADVPGAECQAPPDEAPADAAPPDAAAQFEDRYLRLLAEFDNYRRRAQRDRENAALSGKAELARPLLSVLDNLERAAAHADQAGAAWLEGLHLTIRQFRDALGASGVEPVDPAGEPFDPRFHEAVSARSSEDVPADHVLLVVSRGYRLGDRVLRPAGVIVSTGPEDHPDS